MRFSGHDTFACRTTWLYKGIKLLNESRQDGEYNLSILSGGEATIQLGVGKNMVNAIKYWLLSFGIFDVEENEFSDIAELIYAEDGDDNDADAFIEDRFTLWLLHHEICSRNHATIFNFFFTEYFKRKSTRTFSETEFVASLVSWIKELDEKVPSEKSLRSDLRCLIDTYCFKKSKKATFEDNHTTLLTELGLLKRTDFKSGDNESIYELNTQAALKEPPSLFATLLLKEFGAKGAQSISLDDVYLNLGTVLLLNREDFSKKLEDVSQVFSKEFSFKENKATGIQELQINTSIDWLTFAKKRHYRAHIN